ncbi:MAG TPA: hypothetical protein VMT87_12960 [Vicinamibacteria bacterium]|nr:hypothetical protein [Vicinamibacteria bacterium]
MRMMLSFAAVLLVSPALSGAERHPPQIGPGARVQVSAPAGVLGYTVQGEARRSILGTVEGITSEQLTIRDGKASRTVPFRDISHLKVANGKKRNAPGGAIAGGLIAGLGMTLLAAMSGCDGCDTGDFVSIIGLSAAGGAAAGAGIGALIKTDRWERVAVPTPIVGTRGPFRLSVCGVHRGAVLGVTLAF